MPFTMELVAKCNSFTKICFTNLKIISFENFRFEFLGPRLMLLELIKFVVEIATSFFKHLFFHHNYQIFIFKT